MCGGSLELESEDGMGQALLFYPPLVKPGSTCGEHCGWRVSNEQMRPATQDESKGIVVVNQFLDSMRIDLQSKRGPKKFLDVRREHEPVFEDPDVIEEDHQPDDADETRTPGSRLSQLETPAATENLDLSPERFGGFLSPPGPV